MSFILVNGKWPWKKSCTCEKSGAHLGFFWLMNLKNNCLLKNCGKRANNFRILKFKMLYWKKNKKVKHLEISLFYTCVAKILMVWSTVFTYRARQTQIINFGSFFPFYFFKSQKNQNCEQMKKAAGDNIILYMCTKNHNHMMHGS